MIKLYRFIQLQHRASQGRLDAFFRFYESHDFGPKYQLLADILNARHSIDVGDPKKAEEQLMVLYERLKAYPYFNTDTKIYLSNYITFYVHIAHGNTTYRINPKERPLNAKKLNRMIASHFFHFTDYAKPA